MLTFALGLVAAAMWGARGELAVATHGKPVLSPVANMPVQAALR
jgi:hypothetical protein